MCKASMGTLSTRYIIPFLANPPELEGAHLFSLTTSAKTHQNAVVHLCMCACDLCLHASHLKCLGRLPGGLARVGLVALVCRRQ